MRKSNVQIPHKKLIFVFLTLLLTTSSAAGQIYQYDFSIALNDDPALNSQEYYQMNFQVGKDNRDIEMSVTLDKVVTFYLMIYDHIGDSVKKTVNNYFEGDTDEVEAVKKVTDSKFGGISYNAKKNGSFVFLIFTRNLDRDQYDFYGIEGSLDSSHISAADADDQSSQFSVVLVIGWLFFFILLYRNYVYQKEKYVYHAFNWVISGLELVIIYGWSMLAYLAFLPINLIFRMYLYSRIENELIKIPRIKLIENSSEETKYTLMGIVIVALASISGFLATQIPLRLPDEFKFWLPVWAIVSGIYLVYAYHRSINSEGAPKTGSNISSYLFGDKEENQNE